MTKKKTKRSRTKHPALDPKKNLKSRQDLIDYDYLHKLTPKELNWLNKFTEEYTNASLDRKNLRNNFHNTKELKKDCDRRANKRKRDLFTALKVNNMIDNWEEYKNKTMATELEQFEDLDDSENKPSNTHDTSSDESDDFQD